MSKADPYHDAKVCENCMFWSLTNPAHGGNDTGLCRRYPPTVKSEWPRVGQGDWCGEFRKLSDLARFFDGRRSKSSR